MIQYLRILIGCTQFKKSRIHLVLCLVCFVATMPRALYAAPSGRALLLRGGTLWTATGSILKDHDILLRNGKIAAIGPRIEAPDALVVDVRGKHITPGLIDTHSHMGVYPIPWASAHADGNEMVKPITAYASAEHAFWPQDPAIPRALEGGTTTAQILPGSANLIGGRSVIVRLQVKRTVQAMRFPHAPYGVKMACGENPKRVHRNQTRTRMGNIALMRMAFQQAREYKLRWENYHRDLASWKKKQSASSPTSAPKHQDTSPNSAPSARNTTRSPQKTPHPKNDNNLATTDFFGTTSAPLTPETSPSPRPRSQSGGATRHPRGQTPCAYPLLSCG